MSNFDRDDRYPANASRRRFLQAASLAPLVAATAECKAATGPLLFEPGTTGIGPLKRIAQSKPVDPPKPIDPPEHIDPAWRAGMPLNRFSPIPGSAPAEATGMGSAFIKPVIEDYHGLATDLTNLESYSIAAGGHHSTEQIGGYKFNWRAGRWSLVVADPGFAPYPANQTIPYFPGGQPTSGHLYYATFMVIIDGVPVWVRIHHGAATYTGANFNQVDAFRTDTKKFERWPPIPNTSYGTGGATTAMCAAQDPRTQFIWVLRPIPGSYDHGVTVLNPFKRTWAIMSNGLNGWGVSYVGMLIDTLRNRLVIGSSDSFGDAKGKRWDAFGAWNMISGGYSDHQLNGPGVAHFNATPYAGRGPGGTSLIHVERIDRYLLLMPTNGKVLRIHPDTWNCDLFTTTLPVDSALNQSSFSRFMALPKLRGVGYVPGWTSRVQFMPIAA